MGEIDPAWSLMPKDQIDRVLNQEHCDIDPAFLGFTSIYIALADIIPKHWTVVDLGCAFAPQALVFRDHRAYVGVDIGGHERFEAANTTHYTMSIADFVAQHADEFDGRTTFAICSYVPPWHHDNMALARDAFQNVFTYYPSRDPSEPVPFRGSPKPVSP